MTDPFGLETKVPDGFWEYNKDRFSREKFYSKRIPDKARDYLIRQFKNKYPFGFNDKGLSDLGRNLHDGMPNFDQLVGEDCANWAFVGCFVDCFFVFENRATDLEISVLKKLLKYKKIALKVALKASVVATGYIGNVATAYDTYRCGKSCSVHCKRPKCN